MFVNNNFTGGEIDRVITQIGDVARGAGKQVQILPDEDALRIACRSSLRGSTNCLAGIVFHSSPSEGPDGAGWNYTMRADGSLGAAIVVTKQDNDPETYVLPLQHAVDYAIAGVNRTNDESALPEVDEYPYTSQTQEQRNTSIRIRYMGALINILGVAFFIGICGILYQQVGLQAAEREIGMSQLLEAMMPNSQRWQPQAVRLLSYHFAFTLLYLPGWIIMAIILQIGVFARTNIGIVLVLHILTGLSLASFSLFVAAFFKRAQLSGITAILTSLVLGVIAQVYAEASNGAVIFCSLVFPSMNYTYFIVLMARWEAQDMGTNLVRRAPENPWSLVGIVFWIFLILQILIYPVLGALVERALWGTSGGRRLLPNESTTALELDGFSKHYYPTWLSQKLLPVFGRKKKETVIAADNLNLKILPGQLTVLLGANGCGKSTTLDAIAGLSKPTHRTISLNFGHGLGLTPQKNVHWPLLTVYEHVLIFNRLKSVGPLASKQEKLDLIRDCDLDRKVGAKAGSLSGGQMRKLQLSMMFTGDSRLCLIDECTSGIDPLARQKIQEIILAERSRANRTMLFTSHYLDEAEIADRVVIMSKGKIRMDGSVPEIKQSGMYRIHLFHTPSISTAPRFEGVEFKEMYDQTIYTVPSAKAATDLISKIEEHGEFQEYQVSGPTIEDAFLKVAEEMVPSARAISTPENSADESAEPAEKMSEQDSTEELKLQDGALIGPFRQGLVLFMKRLLVFRRNVLPNLVAFLIPPIAAGLVSLFITHYPGAGCTPTDQVSQSDIASLGTQLNHEQIVVGPSSKLGLGSLQLVASTFNISDLGGIGGGSGNSSGSAGGANLTQFLNMTKLVNTLDEFNSYISQNYQNVTPGGAFLGDRMTLAYKANSVIALPFLVQNIADTLVTNMSISAQYQAFDIPWQADAGNTLQFIVYLGLCLSVAPAFFTLYPTLERLRNVRSLHYSNGVRSLPLWLAYIGFDFIFVLVASALVTIIFRAVSHIFYGLGQLFVVLVLYGLTSTLLAYVVSLFANSQLAAFAVVAAYGGVTFLLYMIAYLSTLTYAPVNDIDRLLLVVHYTLAIVFPSASMTRALFVALNEFSVNCRGPSLYVSSPADFTAYGAPITYLIIQSLLLFAFLVWWDSGSRWGVFRRKKTRDEDDEDVGSMEPEVADEVSRVRNSTTDGLRVLNLSKRYGKNLAVDDVSFGVKRGEVFALLGPNGAGKSTTVSMIRGNIQPSNSRGDIFIENISMRKRGTTARQHLSVVPQFDAMDSLTVLEHLRFYARVRGVSRVEENVKEIVQAVGLDAFQTRMGNSLSGGNKRKLSLGIALMGNPGVMLCDEPSAGLDVAAKRIMWRTLEAVIPGRSCLLVTHSMEEVDRLCQRVGIMARRMLALGTSEHLRKKHGDRYHVHVLLGSAPYTTAEEAEKAVEWVRETFEGAQIETPFHGQLRFSVPASADRGGVVATAEDDEDSINKDKMANEREVVPGAGNGKSGIAALFLTLESSKKQVGFEYYSVSRTTLDQVFLSIVGKHKVEEENYGAVGGAVGERTEIGKKGKWGRWIAAIFCF